MQARSRRLLYPSPFPPPDRPMRHHGADTARHTRDWTYEPEAPSRAGREQDAPVAEYDVGMGRADAGGAQRGTQQQPSEEWAFEPEGQPVRVARRIFERQDARGVVLPALSGGSRVAPLEADWQPHNWRAEGVHRKVAMRLRAKDQFARACAATAGEEDAQGGTQGFAWAEAPIEGIVVGEIDASDPWARISPSTRVALEQALVAERAWKAPQRPSAGFRTAKARDA